MRVLKSQRPVRTYEERKALFAEYTDGILTVRALAKKHGCSTRTIYLIAHEFSEVQNDSI